ncbi:MAG: carbohydrate binding domain-containing protein [Janthinobacterium lividum]
MKYPASLVLSLLSALTLGLCRVTPADPSKPAPAVHTTPFIQSAYLWTQGTDTDLSGDGDWGMYKSWLGVPKLGAETDPGGWDSWANTTEGWDNNHWGDQQTKVGTAVLPDILLGIGTMPYDTTQSDSWNQKMVWESQQWQNEASNDPATMAHFVNLGNHIVDWHYKSVIIRMDYEFDGGWDPYGNLNAMSNMPGNFIKAWQNIVTTVRKTVHDRDPNIKVKFLWNPTDANVQVSTAAYYPGDAYVDYIGFDNYDSDYSGIYKAGVQPDAATEQAAWTNSVGKRVQWFADFASAADPGHRNGYVAGRSVPLIVGEWGLWQVDPSGRPAGGDDPVYIQNMYDWMSKNNVYMESYFETPSDGRSTLWPGGYPGIGSGNRSWGTSGSPYPKSAALYRKLFGNPVKPFAPAAPAGLSAASGFKYATLNWQASSADPIATYSLYRGTEASDPTKTPLATGLTATSYLDKGLSNGVTYYYKVKAVNSVGASAFSSVASVKPSIPANFVLNGGFESGDLSPWQLQAVSNAGASYTEGGGSVKAHSGSRQYTHWANSPYEVTLFQNIALTNGPHTVSAWVKSSGGQAACRMEVTANGVKSVFPITATDNSWKQISTTVNVTAGSVTVGFYSKASANQWLNVDDVVVK